MHKKIWMLGIAAALFGAALALPTLAQTGNGGGATPSQHRGMAQLKKLADYLGLTDNQKAQMSKGNHEEPGGASQSRPRRHHTLARRQEGENPVNP